MLSRYYGLANKAYLDPSVKLEIVSGGRWGLTAVVSPASSWSLVLRATMEAARGKPIDDNGPEGQPCYRLSPTPVRPVRHALDRSRCRRRVGDQAPVVCIHTPPASAAPRSAAVGRHQRQGARKTSLPRSRPRGLAQAAVRWVSKLLCSLHTAHTIRASLLATATAALL